MEFHELEAPERWLAALEDVRRCGWGDDVMSYAHSIVQASARAIMHRPSLRQESRVISLNLTRMRGGEGEVGFLNRNPPSKGLSEIMVRDRAGSRFGAAAGRAAAGAAVRVAA